MVYWYITLKMDKKEKCLVSLVKFYKVFLGGTIDAVRELAQIESEFGDQYKELKELQKNPDILLQISEDMPEEGKAILFEMFMRSASLSTRTARLFDLTLEEKKKLASDLVKFSKDMDGYIVRLSKAEEETKQTEDKTGKEKQEGKENAQ